MNASLRGRGYGEQLRHAVTVYLVLKPHLALLLIGGAVAAWRTPMLRVVWLVTVLPMTLAWFLFGAYQLRLGLHVVGLSALLLIAGLTAQAADAAVRPFAWRGLVAAAAILLLIGGGVAAEAARKHGDLRDGARITFRTQYGAQADAAFDRLLAAQARVFATSNYAYGALYGRVPVGRPDYARRATAAQLRDDLVAFRADYAVASDALSFGPHGALLTALAKACEKAFVPVLTPPNPAGFTLYRVDRNALMQPDCAP